MGVDFLIRRVLDHRAGDGRKLASGHEYPLCQGVASGHPKGRSAAKEPRSGLTRRDVLTPRPTSCGSSRVLFAIYARIYAAVNSACSFSASSAPERGDRRCRRPVCGRGSRGGNPRACVCVEKAPFGAHRRPGRREQGLCRGAPGPRTGQSGTSVGVCPSRRRADVDRQGQGADAARCAVRGRGDVPARRGVLSEEEKRRSERAHRHRPGSGRVGGERAHRRARGVGG